VIPEVLPRMDFLVLAKLICKFTAHASGAPSPAAAAAAEDGVLTYPEFLETLGLAAFALARATAMSHLGMLRQVQGLLKATVEKGAPWARLPQGAAFVAAL
jgi:hypothetical protein